jgi:hypothetical protein
MTWGMTDINSKLEEDLDIGRGSQIWGRPLNIRRYPGGSTSGWGRERRSLRGGVTDTKDQVGVAYHHTPPPSQIGFGSAS